MKSNWLMRIRLTAFAAIMPVVCSASDQDPLAGMFALSPEWHIGAELSPAWVPGTNGFLEGDNQENKRIDAALSGDLRLGFSFNPATRQGLLYKDLYQGIGVGVNSFFAGSMIGTPVSAYAYQGAPIIHFNDRLWLGYEWQFGAAFGWKKYDEETNSYNEVAGSTVTAHMGIALKLNYRLAGGWMMSFGATARHYSNGNTSWPNAGLNSIGASIGISYTLNPQREDNVRKDATLEAEADRPHWFYDILAYGAWRKRIVSVGEPEETMLCPGKFGVAGVQFAPMRQLNRWIAVGPALDLQWDEGAGLEPYWISGSYDENVKFERPPFGKQISAGVSAHAELTMPIFSVNAGLGFDFINPKGDKAFYQMLTLKTFVTDKIFLNVGYRLGNFKDPQNLMLGLGVRL